MKHILSPILLSLLLTACGGGGGTASTSVTPTIPAIPASLYDTSYKNFKLNGIDSIQYPNYRLRWGGDPLAVGFGDFIKAGELGVFVAYQNYGGWDSLSQIQSNPASYASEYVFYTVNADKSLTKSISLKGCLHPRKAVVADFNKDGIADVFVACHGYDSSPFPGEKSQLVLSTARGQYTVTDVGDVGFNHGASAADINGDGYPDIVVADSLNIVVYINQKNGTFVKDTTKINTLNLPYFVVELIDVDNDGKVDVVAGGNEFNNGATTKILFGSNNGDFKSRYINVPSIQNNGTVNDFTLVGNILYIDRTTDQSSNLGLYSGMKIQSYNLTTGVSSIVADVSGKWIPWLLPKTKNNQNGVGPFDSSAFYQ